MARHYYLTRSGRLRRKDNTLSFIPVEKEEFLQGSADLSDDYRLGFSRLKGAVSKEIGSAVNVHTEKIELENELAGSSKFVRMCW